MEAFSLLKYWRSGGLVASNPPPLNATSAVVESHDDDDGPFFDLEFSPDDTNDSSTSDEDDESDDVEVSQVEVEEEEDNDDVEEGEEEGEFNFTVTSGSSNDRTDTNLTMSPTDDLFFKGKLVQIESDVFNSAEPNSKTLFSGTLLKSATKFRVFMSGLKKSKSNIISAPKNTDGSQTEQLELVEEKRQETTSKLRRRVSTVKLFKVEEVPIVSLFTRDNSSRISAKSLTGQRSQIVSDEAAEAAAAKEEKRFSKEVVQKYLKMVKPLYVSVSKRKTNRPETVSGQLSFPADGEAAATVAAERSSGNNNVRGSLMKQGNIPAGLRVVCKHLGKSRSASLAVAAGAPGTVTSQRRDDSLLQQQDGIQSAILHCKRSFNASRDSGLSRSESHSSPSDE